MAIGEVSIGGNKYVSSLFWAIFPGVCHLVHESCDTFVSVFDRFDASALCCVESSVVCNTHAECRVTHIHGCTESFLILDFTAGP